MRSLLISILLLAAGCHHESPQQPSSVSSVPEVHVVKPQKRNLVCRVDQPGFVEAFEQTAIFSKVSGFIQKYDVDIGQQVKKGDPIVEIFVPELQEAYQQKVSQVALDRTSVEQMRELVVVAQSKIQTAVSRLAEAKADVERYQADIVRWESEVRRLTKMVQQHVVDQEVLDETQKQLAASRASHDASLAAVDARQAERASAEADLGKSKVDVKTALAQVQVAEADERRTAALLAYTKVTSPYDGVITVRNANTGDYVQAATGDANTPRGAPMFVIARDDLVRIFSDLPQNYVGYVHVGTTATVRPDPLSNWVIDATVARTSWGLRARTRTLWVEIDLPTRNFHPPSQLNSTPAGGDGLRPGMYVNTTLIIERSEVFALPADATLASGNATYCYLVKGGKAVKASLVRGVDEGSWVEVAEMRIDDHWTRVSGEEEVIVGDLGELTDGEPVEVATQQ